MPSLSFLFPGSSSSPPAHRKATITDDIGALTYTVPVLADSGIDEAASRWNLTDRPGLHPLTQWAGPGAVVASLTIRIGNDLVTSIERDIAILRGMARSTRPVVVALGQFSRWSSTGFWVITTVKVDDQLLIQGSNDACQAVVTLGLTSAMTPKLVQTTGK